MLLRMLKYPFPSIRARALATRFLGTEDFFELAELSDHHRAFPVLSDKLDVSFAADPERGEGLLGPEFLGYGQLFARSLPGRGRRLLEAYLRRVDVQNLKVVCRGLLRDKDPAAWTGLLVEPGSVGEFSTDELRQLETVEQLRRRLHRHPYGHVLASASREEDIDRRLARTEILLERAFWDRVASCTDRLARFDRLAAREILALRGDVEGFRLLLRGLRGELPGELLLEGLPPLTCLFSPETVARLLKEEAPEERLAHLLPLRDVREPLGREGEVALFRRLHESLWKALRGHPFDVSASLAALLLKELEGRDIQVVLGGLRFGRKRDEIGAMLASVKG